MSNLHVLPFMQVPFSTFAKLDWVVSYCPLYPLFLAGLIWEEQSNGQTHKELF